MVEVSSQLNGLGAGGRAVEIGRPEGIAGGIKLAGGRVNHGIHISIIERLDAVEGGGVGFLILR